MIKMSGKELFSKMTADRKRGFLSGTIVMFIICSTILLAYTISVRGASPSISYASPSNGATFVSVWRGEGVNITVNVTDADGDLNQVVLKWNNSGSWSTFYDSGALGGVSYHNHTVLNTNFTGSWHTYEWQICAYDIAWHNTTYSFTTEYVWGDEQIVTFNDVKNLYYPSILKNNTDDYFVAWVNWDDYDVEAIHSTKVDFIANSVVDVDTDTRNYDGSSYSNTNRLAYLYSYNNKCYIAYTDDDASSNSNHYYTKYWNGSAWIGKTDTGIPNVWDDGVTQGHGAFTIYYNGEWQTFLVRYYYSSNYYTALYWYHGSSPFSGTATLIENYGTLNDNYNFYQSSTILEGKLVLVYRDVGDDLHWRTYDGVSWTDKGDIEADIGDYGCSVVKDPVNNQLVLVYINATGNMYYRTLTDPTGSWSSPHLIFTPASGKTIKHPYVSYIDHRVTIVFSYNLRGTYDIYMISAPDYMSNPLQGWLAQYGRIKFPDAVPNQQHVNSSVVAYKNIGHRNFVEFNRTFADIGSIQCENGNIRLWGSVDNTSWTSLGVTDANGKILHINSTTWATGMPWNTGDVRYFKYEIVDVGSVPEDLHSCDYQWEWEITLS